MNPLTRNIAIGAGIAVVAVLVFRRSEAQKQADAELGFTEETGVVGTLGAAANRASGGLLARFGSFLSDKLDPVNRKTLDELTAPIDQQPTKQIKRGSGPKLTVVPILPESLDG